MIITSMLRRKQQPDHAEERENLMTYECEVEAEEECAQSIKVCILSLIQALIAGRGGIEGPPPQPVLAPPPMIVWLLPPLGGVGIVYACLLPCGAHHLKY